MENCKVQDPDFDDAGLGLIEIIVSMFLLALVAMAFLPVLIQGMKASVSNATLATAGQLVSEQMDQARALPSTCEALSAFDDVAVATAIDARGTVFLPHRQVGACPTAYPGLVAVRVWVTKDGASDPISEADTLVYVSSDVAPTP